MSFAKKYGVSQFTIKGGKYGNYKIGFKLDNEEMYRLTADSIFLSYKTDPMLIFSYMNTNWWNITRMDLSAEITDTMNRNLEGGFSNE